MSNFWFWSIYSSTQLLQHSCSSYPSSTLIPAELPSRSEVKADLSKHCQPSRLPQLDVPWDFLQRKCSVNTYHMPNNTTGGKKAGLVCQLVFLAMNTSSFSASFLH